MHREHLVPVIISLWLGAAVGALAQVPTNDEILKVAREKIQAQYPSETARAEAYRVVADLVAALGDPRALFLPAAAVPAHRGERAGSFGGIGAVLEAKPGEGGGEQVVATALLPGGPAARGGLRPGDVLTRIDQTPLAGLDLAGVVKLLRGAVGTPVVLAVSRAGGEQPQEFRLVRDVVGIRTVEWRLLEEPEKVGYVWIRALNTGTAGEVRQALTELGLRGVSGLIVDLSGNADGEDEEAARQVGSMLTDSTSLFWVRPEKEQPRPVAPAGPPSLNAKLPLVVLIDGRTAGLAEVLVGTLQDRRRAVVVGQPSAGAVHRYEFISLADTSALVLPTGVYLTAEQRDLGLNMGQRGVQPEVALPAPQAEEVRNYRQWHEQQIEAARQQLLKLLLDQ